ncbi:TPA: hypothetical protein KNH94_000161 [Clostridioides difficile]|nr:hypothetical protein [Clostridioides difficile]
MIKIWDKKEKINGVSAEEILKGNYDFQTSEVFLILDDYNRVTNIESVNTIKSIYKLDKNLTALETAEKYLEMHKKQEEEIKTHEELEKNSKNATIATHEEVKALREETAALTFAMIEKELI